MIEEEAVKTLMKIGSNKVMTEYLHKNIIAFTPEESEDYIDVVWDEEEE